MNNVRQGFTKRFIAALLDGLLLVIVMVPVVLALRNSPRMMNSVCAIIGLAYGAMEIFKAQTLGKMILKIKITRQDGSDAPMDALIKRYAIKYSSSLISLLAGIVGGQLIANVAGLAGVVVVIGFCLVFRADKLALHDIIAKTAVYGPDALTISIPAPSAPPAKNG